SRALAHRQRIVAGRAGYSFECRQSFTSAMAAGYRLCFPCYSADGGCGIPARVPLVSVRECQRRGGLAGRWGGRCVFMFWGQFLTAEWSKEEVKFSPRTLMTRCANRVRTQRIAALNPCAPDDLVPDLHCGPGYFLASTEIPQSILFTEDCMSISEFLLPEF